MSDLAIVESISLYAMLCFYYYFTIKLLHLR